MPWVLINNKLVELTVLLGDGGAGRVYALPKDKRFAVKLYDRPEELDPRRVAAMQSNLPWPLFVRNGTPTLAVPLGLVYEPGSPNPVGVYMARIHDAVPLSCVVNPLNRIPEIHARWLLRTATSFVLRVYYLHWSGYVIGDIQLANALANRHGQVTFIDLDSLQFETVAGVFFPALYGVPSFQAPEVQGADLSRVRRTQHSDVFSTAIVVHMLLLGEHPFNCQYRGKGRRPDLVTRMREGWWPDSGRYPDFRPPRGAPEFSTLPKGLQELFRRTFDREGHVDPTKRPSITEFATCLEKLDGTRRCSISRSAWRAQFAEGSARPLRMFKKPLVRAAAASLLVGGGAAYAAYAPLGRMSTDRVPLSVPVSPRPVAIQKGNEPTPALWRRLRGDASSVSVSVPQSGEVP